MTDFHIHILPNFDDGSHSLAESLAILERMSALGFKHIVCTPHFIPDSKYTQNNQTKSKALHALRTATKKRGINITLSLGNEVYIDTNIITLIKNHDIKLINNKYLLFELPFNAEVNNLRDIIHDFKMNHIIPILAHPERYTYFQKNPTRAAELKSTGVLFQANYGSIIGAYGPAAKKLLKFFLKNNLIDFFCTDIHHLDSPALTSFPLIKQKLAHLVGPEKLSAIINNADKLLS